MIHFIQFLYEVDQISRCATKKKKFSSTKKNFRRKVNEHVDPRVKKVLLERIRQLLPI